MRTQIGCPEPGDREMQRAWEVWMTAWELASFENGKSAHEETFWRVWNTSSRFDAKAFTYQFVKPSLSEGVPACHDEEKLRLVREWLSETKDWIDRQRVSSN